MMAITLRKGVSDGDIDGLVSDGFVLDNSWQAKEFFILGNRIKAIYFHL